MVRVLYALAVITLIGGSALAAKNMEGRRGIEGGAAIAFLASMQR